MQLIRTLLAFIFSISACAIPDSPVDATGGASGTNTGNALGSGLGSVAAASSATSASSTGSRISSATLSSASSASTKSAAADLLLPDWAIVGGLAVVAGGAAML